LSKTFTIHLSNSHFDEIVLAAESGSQAVADFVRAACLSSLKNEEEKARFGTACELVRGGNQVILRVLAKFEIEE
jgi:hypothetical protein